MPGSHSVMGKEPSFREVSSDQELASLHSLEDTTVEDIIRTGKLGVGLERPPSQAERIESALHEAYRKGFADAGGSFAEGE